MTDPSISLPLAGNPLVRVTTSSGRIAFHAEDRPDILIQSGAPPLEKIEISGEEIHFHSDRKGSRDLVVRVPSSMSIVAGTASGDISMSGSYGEVRATTASGNIAVDEAETVDLRTISGDVNVARCSGRCRLQSVSGRALVASCGSSELSTVSGDVELQKVSGDAKVRTVSGRIEITSEGKGTIAVKTVSGGVRIAVPQGTSPNAKLVSLGSTPRCALPGGADCEIDVVSMSGKIEIIDS
ncbi:MAG: DUF4097 family beta strand repeat protein [Dehalococcoidia bacterium]|nr:DUF4097 family beta strand repeat protein [Dehalococcoidia bacterium]